ncbi:MAG: hypothetical protein Ct9H90mP17_4530 [Actinomycetota bacterium]|nr:MAG: hypothetical protein Ct9H90mP17_4530 [Actinomycetota bacterium]
MEEKIYKSLNTGTSQEDAEEICKVNFNLDVSDFKKVIFVKIRS